MKTQFVIYPAMVGMLYFSCAKKEKDPYTKSMEEQTAARGPLQEDKENMKKLEGTEPLGSHALEDTLLLPDPVKIILKRDSATALHKIRKVRRYTEDGMTFYEITFDTQVGEDQVITYDDHGKIKSPDVDRPQQP